MNRKEDVGRGQGVEDWSKALRGDVSARGAHEHGIGVGGRARLVTPSPLPDVYAPVARTITDGRSLPQSVHYQLHVPVYAPGLSPHVEMSERDKTPITKATFNKAKRRAWPLWDLQSSLELCNRLRTKEGGGEK